MNRQRQDELDRLLARGRLSRPEKERMFADVAHAIAPRRRFSWRVAGILVPAFAVIALVPLGLVRSRHDGFRGKGLASGPTIEAGCAGGCRQGSTLVFRTAHVTQPSLLAAWAEDEHGARIWYFPTDAGELPSVPPHDAVEVIGRGARIGAEHGAARYTLHARLVSPGPHTRDELLRDEASATQLPLEIQR